MIAVQKIMGDTGMTQSDDTKKLPQYLLKDEQGVYKLRLPGKEVDSKGNRKNGARFSLQTTNLNEALYIYNNLFQKYSCDDINGFENTRRRSVVENIKQSYMNNQNNSILVCAMKLYDISLDYETALAFYRDSLSAESTDRYIGYKREFSISVEKIILDTKELNDKMYNLTGKYFNDPENIKLLSELNDKFKDYYIQYICVKNMFDEECLKDTSLKIYQDRINTELGLLKSTALSNKSIVPIDTEVISEKHPEEMQEQQENHSLEYYVINYVLPNKQAFTTKYVIVNGIYKLFKYIGINKNTIIDPCKSLEYAKQILEKIVKLGAKISNTTIGHYKSYLKTFFDSIRYECGTNAEYHIGHAINQIENMVIKGQETTGYTPFTEKQLKDMFSKDSVFFKQNSSSFWTCVLSLFCGSRANMARTLLYKDIYQNMEINDGTWCIKFVENDVSKKAKTKASQRIIPIHPQLIDLGFVDFIKNKQKYFNKKPTDHIFEDMFHPNGDLKTDMTTLLTYNVFREVGAVTQIGKTDLTENKRYGFHSFRKNANQVMESAGLTATEINCLIGWEGDGTTRQKNYGNRPLEDLINANSKFSYDFLKEEFAYWKGFWGNYYENK